MCYQIAVGKNASADGSVMVARNCDTTSTEAQQIISVPRQKHHEGETIRIPDTNNVVIPQVKETYAYTAIMSFVPGEAMGMVAGGINEFQLSAGSSSGGWVKSEVNALTPFPETVLSDYIMTLVLERFKTAREAILWLGEMIENYGARIDNYIVADPNEAWLLRAISRLPLGCCSCSRRLLCG